MKENNYKIGILSGNVLKIIASVCMLIDHIGMIFFPTQAIFRKIGRIAFPVFAYFIAVGCNYTKNKIKHFFTIFILGALFQLVFYIVENSLYLNVFLTFSVSILLIYLLQEFKRAVVKKYKTAKILFYGALFVFGVILTYFLNERITFDGSFWGCMAPVFASLFTFEKDLKEEKPLLSKFDFIPISVCMLGIGIILVAISLKQLQFYSLLSLPLLLLYSGERGKLNIKYFFYFFYPSHFVILYAIRLLLNYLR